METDIPVDARVKAYERRCKMIKGKGPAVAIDPGTRVYREIGSDRELRHWLSDVQTDFNGELVPFEWVADYIGVSRAALHKRVNRGGLTVLVFEQREHVSGILGGVRDRMRREYKFVPRTECDAWRDLLLKSS